MTSYHYEKLQKIMKVKVGEKYVWRERIRAQTQYIHLIEKYFGTQTTDKAFGFYPGKLYFGTPLSYDPAYTKKMLSQWKKIKALAENFWWDVYAPFEKTDPHAKVADKLSAFEIAELDHVQVLTAELALIDLNRPSHGVGQEIQLGIFMPVIGFSKNYISRMVRGMPGTLVIKYKKFTELKNLLAFILKRESFIKEPFYIEKCQFHKPFSIFKGEKCLRCLLKKNLHGI